MSKIPEGWKWENIGNVIKTSSGGTPNRNKKEYFQGSNLWVTTGELNDSYIFNTKEHISDDAIKNSSAKLFPSGTILMAMYGATIGKLGILTKVATSNQACCAFLENDTVVNKYLFYYLFFIRSVLIGLGCGAGQPNISQQIVKDLSVLLPPLEEQKKIAEILSSVDRSIEATEKLISKLSDLKKALMQELFTKGIGHSRFKNSPLGKIPEEWEVVRLGDVAKVKTGPFGAQLHESDYLESGTPIITVEHLGEHGVTYQNLPRISDDDKNRLCQYMLEEGDIVFSRVGSVDRNCIIKKTESGWLFSGRLLRIRFKKEFICPHFINFFFHQEMFKRYIRSVAVGGTMPSLNTSILEDVLIVLSAFAEQNEIASILSANDAKIEKAQKRLEKLKDMKKALMQDLLTGKKRVNHETH